MRILFAAAAIVLALSLGWADAPARGATLRQFPIDPAAAGPALSTSGVTGPPYADSRLSEGQANKIASADPGVTMILAKHPELVRHAAFKSDTRSWEITWTDARNGREFIHITVDDQTGKVTASDIQSEAYFDALPALSEAQVIDTARKQQPVIDELADHPDAQPSASLGSDSVWTVSFYDGSSEIARVTIDDMGGNVKEVLVGPQVAWQMARGYKGAFGRIINEAYVWLPLCLLFLLPFFDLRRPLRIFNLDLLMLLSFTVSHYFFNQGEIFRSVPLSYPPLAYLFLRLLWTAVRRVPRRRSPQPPVVAETDSRTFAAMSAAGRPRRGDGGDDDLDTDAAGHVHLNFPPLVLAIGLAALIIFRITINIADSNVVDVGYSGVIGAHRIIENQTPYGHMASDDQNGDTYGPLNYLLYVPFERTLQWSGKWDDLPAAHAAAIFFDLVTIAGMFMAGRSLARSRRAGNRLGLALAYAWAAFPYTTFVLNCNVNDTIQAAFLVWGFVFIRRGLISGLLLGLGMQIKFFPAMLGPLWASFPNAFRNWKRRALFVLGLVAGAAVVMPVVFMGDGSLHTFLQHSIEWQWGRQSPFSLWGQYPDRLARVQHVGQYVLASLAVLAYFLPWKKNRIQLAAASAALVIGFQILQTHWFYLYIPWFFPLAMIALMVASGRPGAKRMETGLVAG